MKATAGAMCCMRSCDRRNETPDVELKIWPPSDLPPIHASAHSPCLDQVRETSVEPDLPGELGSIPANARCLFCGEKLPIVGEHPYALELEGPSRFWAHATCLKSEIDLSYL